MSKKSLLAILGFVFLTGCASYKQGDQTVEVELRKFLPPANTKTSLYVCREDSFFASEVRTTVIVDNTDIGTTRRNTFVHSVVDAGKHIVQIKNDGIAAISNTSISFDSEPGEIAFLWIGVTGHGWGAYTIDHFEGKKQGMDCVKNATYSIKAN